jgi:hypothetical protein
MWLYLNAKALINVCEFQFQLGMEFDVLSLVVMMPCMQEILNKHVAYPDK